MPGLLSKTTFSAGALIGAAFLFTGPAEAASFRCAATAAVDLAVVGSDTTTSTPCGVQYGVPGASAFADVSAHAGVLRANSHGSRTTVGSAGGVAFGEAIDDVVVSGLGDEGATLNFRVSVTGFLFSNASSPAPPLFQGAAASSDVISLVQLSTSAGRSAGSDIRACTRNVESIISTCNGEFDYLVGDSVTVDVLAPVSIFVRNGDSLRVLMSLRTSSLAKTTLPSQGATSTADFGHTVYWDGLVFDDATRNVVLTSTSGFDYRYSAFPDPSGGVPEPGTWALMIAGFGLAGVALRRRAALAA